MDKSKNPFKKASNDIKKSKNLNKMNKYKESDAKARTCPNCGAPRDVDSDISRCEYCGYIFMKKEVKI